MPAEQELSHRPQPDGPVRWAIPPQELDSLSLPTPEILDNRALVVEVDGQKLAIGIFALPPQDSSASKFWKGVKSRVGMPVDAALPPTRLQIEPPVPVDKFRKGDHTRLSAMHPYVVMEHGTRYGIGIWTPHKLIGDWSEPKERSGGVGSFNLLGETEIYQERPTVAALIRLDGDTPLIEHVQPGLNPVRSEMFIGINEDKKVGQTHTARLVGNRVVREEGKKKGEVSDLAFKVTAARGTKDNAQISNSGLIQVVLVREVDDKVIERVQKGKLFLGDIPESSNRSYGMYDARSLTRDTAPDSTVVGRTEFSGTRRRPVSEPTTIRDVQPIAVFNLVLVGNGGPITAEMTEAPMPQQS